MENTMVTKKPKYYKALTKDGELASLHTGAKYKIGILHRKEPIFNLGLGGYYYTDNVYWLTRLHESDTYDVYEVQPSGDITYDQEKHQYCSSEITIIRRLTESEIDELVEKYLEELQNMNNSYLSCTFQQIFHGINKIGISLIQRVIDKEIDSCYIHTDSGIVYMIFWRNAEKIDIELNFLSGSKVKHIIVKENELAPAFEWMYK